jgi:RHS repeat-associated protein
LTYNKVNELTNKGFVYDAAGELVSDGVRNYAWDAQHRLVGVTQGGTRTGFAYDGLGRRIAIVTAAAGRTTASDFIWCGARLCQSRSGASAVARLYYPEGEVLVPQSEKLFYGPDQLGSVRDMDVVSATVSAPGQEYDYDPYGNPIKTPEGVTLTDFRYAGMFYPGNGAADGGLGLTQYRAYDPRIARWLSRDLLGEKGGISLFAYADDDPIDRRDVSGLLPEVIDYLGIILAGLTAVQQATTVVTVVTAEATPIGTISLYGGVLPGEAITAPFASSFAEGIALENVSFVGVAGVNGLATAGIAVTSAAVVGYFLGDLIDNTVIQPLQQKYPCSIIGLNTLSQPFVWWYRQDVLVRR